MLRCRGGGRYGSRDSSLVRHNRFMKDNMAGENDALGFEIIAFIAFCGGRVTEEDAWSGAGGKLVGCVMLEMGIAETAEGMEVIVVR